MAKADKPHSHSQTELPDGAEVPIAESDPAQKQTEVILLETQAQLQHLLFSSPAVVYTRRSSGDYGITFISENVALHFGYEACEFLEDVHFWISHLHPEDGALALKSLVQLQVGEEGACEYRLLQSDGSSRWIQDRFRLVQTPAGSTWEIVGCWQDITVRKQAEAELQLRDRLLQGVTIATSQLLTIPDYITAINQSLAILGEAAAVDRVYIYENHAHPETGAAVMSLRHEWARETVEPLLDLPAVKNQPLSALGLQPWQPQLSSGATALIRPLSLKTDPHQAVGKAYSTLLVPILVEKTLWGLIGFCDCQGYRLWSQSEELILTTMANSISGALQRNRVEARLLRHALYDSLTNLPNRTLFMNRLEYVCKQTRREPQRQFAVLFLDLDRFKLINDSLGHQIGDQLLMAVARRLETCVRPGDTVARLAGDEFTILLEDLKQPEDARAAAERIIATLSQPLQVGGQEMLVSVSIGIALYPCPTTTYTDPTRLLRDADSAMYRAKSRGRNCYQVFNNSMQNTAMAEMQLERDLRWAIDRDEFQTYYQPIVSLDTGRIVGVEALVRWLHPRRGLVSPEEFIPQAEETGMITAIGEQVLAQSCRHLQHWQEQCPRGAAELNMSVNVSARQLLVPGLSQQIQEILQSTGLEGHRLKLEITESAIVQNDATTEAMIKQLRNQQIQLHMDDFGAGYSSLSYLNYLPISAIKIDRQFISMMFENERNLNIVRTIITLAQTTGVDVIAEGVETIAQLKQLRKFGCNFAQGYYFSPPLPPSQVLSLLDKQPKF